LENYPDSSYANKAELGISRLGVLSLIVAQDYNSAQSAFDKMVADFNGHPQLTEAVFQIGEEYYNEGFSAKDEANEIRRQEAKDRFQKAALVFEKIITELPESVPYTTDAYYLSGTCYYLRGTNDGDYNKAIDYFEQALANWPDSWHAGIAQGLIGVCYERLQASRALKEEEAYPLIEQAYKAVIEQYPDCPYYPEYACMRLGWMNFKKGKWADAAQYFELFLQKCPANDPRETDTLYYLGRSYEEMGELGPALQTYRLFLEKSAPASLDPNTLPSATPGAGGVCRPGSTNDRLIEDVKNRVERLEKMNNQ
jgi:TolA-binding protein